MSAEGDPSGVRLSLDLWHPDCWAIEATDQTGGGVLARAVYNSPTTDDTGPNAVTGLFTAFGETESDVRALLDAIRKSDHAGELHELQARFGRVPTAPGNVVREFFLEYDPNEMICPTLLEHGFVHSAPVRIEDGSEKWQLRFAGDRSELEAALDRVRERSAAEVTIQSITTGGALERPTLTERLDTLTPAQREAFERARDEGYYEWPREVTTRELADELDVAKSTLLGHLRTAESKLLDP